MILVNGEHTDKISVADRGLQYGDGVFETIAIHNMQPVFWEQHMDRLLRGCHALNITPPDRTLLVDEAQQLIETRAKGVLKIIITRGQGGRGYRLQKNSPPSRILGIHDWPDYPQHYYTDGIELKICDTRLAPNPALAGIKHLNRLEQVMARAEWDDAYAEGLMLDTKNRVIEGTMTNVFLVKDGILHTPDISECGVAGVARGEVLNIAQALSITTEIRNLQLDDIYTADELFVCNSVAGIWPVQQAGFQHYRSMGMTHRIQREYCQRSGITN